MTRKVSMPAARMEVMQDGYRADAQRQSGRLTKWSNLTTCGIHRLRRPHHGVLLGHLMCLSMRSSWPLSHWSHLRHPPGNRAMELMPRIPASATPIYQHHSCGLPPHHHVKHHIVPVIRRRCLLAHFWQGHRLWPHVGQRQQHCGNTSAASSAAWRACWGLWVHCSAEKRRQLWAMHPSWKIQCARLWWQPGSSSSWFGCTATRSKTASSPKSCLMAPHVLLHGASPHFPTPPALSEPA